MLRNIVAALAVFFMAGVSQAAPSSASTSFRQHFEIVRNSRGGLEVVKIRTVREVPKLSTLIQQLLTDLRDYEVSQTESASALVERVTEDDEDLPAEYRQAMRDSLEGLNSQFAAESMNLNEVQNFQQVFDRKIKLHWDAFKVVAHGRSANFFYARKVTQLVLNFGIDYARATLGALPAIDVVLFLVRTAVSMIESNRTFYQNLLLHYLDTESPSALGLTDAERSMLRTSVFESRVKWWNFWTASKARRDAAGWGNQQFAGLVESGNARVKKHARKFDSVGERVSYALQRVRQKNQAKLVYTIVPKSLFSGAPSNAYNFTKPKAVTRERQTMRLMQFALGFAPIHPLLKMGLDEYLASTYIPQGLMDGALLGFAETERSSLSSVPDETEIWKQTVNPFLARTGTGSEPNAY